MISKVQIDNRVRVAMPPQAGRLLPEVKPDSEKRLFNRELSLVEFFRQVLEAGLDAEAPLLERLRFLTIFANIVDEFFMVRVSGLKEEVEEGWVHPSPDGMTAEEQLREIRSRLRPMVAEQSRALREEVLPQLESSGIVLAPYHSLSDDERAQLDNYFTRKVFPVLTPLAVDPAHPFPYISGLSLNLGLIVKPPDEESTKKSEARFVRLKVPPVLPGLVPVGEAKFVFLSEVIVANLSALFPGMRAGEAHAFRVTRDADIEIRDDEADDLLHALKKGLRKRRFGTPVRLEVAAGMPNAMLDYLTNSLGLESDDIYRVEGPLNIADLDSLCELNRPDLKYRPLRPTVPQVFKERRPIFDVIKDGDVLLHHPYTAYSTVTDFIRAAANDPAVQAIKICLYRTGSRSEIAEALIHAAEQGKQVTALIELKARFDEENNIEWAGRLEHAGVHVVYGLIGLKTHCKLTLVVRLEDGVLKRYVHIATGNYNPTASCTYTDFGLLTANEDFGADATEFFNYLTGYSRQRDYRQLLVAPVNLRENLTNLIERETVNAKAGRPAQIIAKLNRLADPNIIQALYDASAAGVEIDLIVRGICMLRPGVPGLSENIRVRAIVGRFLEHSRILYFANDGDPEVYIGSSDWMPRNLNRRIEVICPINDPRLRSYLRDEVLQAYLRDNVNARVLQPEGYYERVPVTADEERFDSQMYFEGASL
ncbi:MAG: polyphosphate kinase [Blastocatellia bacterium]|jgi:polyphosphate kinase|nr:polyphosphate kinase [Blastocatellia bacterium]